MVRIAGVTLPHRKRIEIALMAIYGIGRSRSRQILREAKIPLDHHTENLTESQEALLRSIVERFPTEGELRRRVSLDLKRLQDIGTWRGYRYRRKLPVRGQTSRRNAHSRRGPKRTGLSGRVVLTKT